MYTICVAVILIFGYAIPGLAYFHNTNFFVNFFILMAYGIGIIGQGLFLSVLLKTSIASSILKITLL